jgi:hypothetical protein
MVIGICAVYSSSLVLGPVDPRAKDQSQQVPPEREPGHLSTSKLEM